MSRCDGVNNELPTGLEDLSTYPTLMAELATAGATPG
jgi:hypothetical protein